MEEDLKTYPENILTLARNPKHLGRMSDPVSAAFIKGPCGDEMEFYLVIDNGIVKEVKFFTNGCVATIACGETAARLALGKSIDDILSISPRMVKDILKGLPEDHSHCSILAVSTLYRAIADYLLRR